MFHISLIQQTVSFGLQLRKQGPEGVFFSSLLIQVLEHFISF